MLPKHRLILLLSLVVAVGCTERPGTNIDSEPALAVLGGAILGTQSNGIVASTKVPSPAQKLFHIFSPVQEAIAAAPACPSITTGTCVGTDLIVFYDNCEATGARSGYWRSYIKYTLPTAPLCAQVLATGFDAASIAALAGQTVTREWGVDQAGDENNIRAGRDNVVAYFYSEFPSGWKDDRVGGVDITFDNATQRTMVVQGVHALGIEHVSPPVADPNAFDLMELATTSEDASVATRWDHTINTVKTGDELFTIGPSISRAGDGSISYGGLSNNTTSSFDGDIVVNSNTIAKGATLRIQHNMSKSVGVMSVTEPLVYSDATCCYPMSGTVETVYDLSLRSPTLKETIVFTGLSCGSITYTTTLFKSAPRTLSHCF